jgi:hypothetical protein
MISIQMIFVLVVPIRITIRVSCMALTADDVTCSSLTISVIAVAIGVFVVCISVRIFIYRTSQAVVVVP